MKTLLLDIAWLAGLLEGEGCFKLQTSGGYKGSVSIALQMTDEDTVRKAAALLNGTVWGPHGPYGVSKQQTYQVAIFGSKAAAWMMTVYPFLGSRRREKVRTLLALWKSQLVMIKGRKASCHPNEPYVAKGRCMVCYNKAYHASVR